MIGYEARKDSEWEGSFNFADLNGTVHPAGFTKTGGRPVIVVVSRLSWLKTRLNVLFDVPSLQVRLQDWAFAVPAAQTSMRFADVESMVYNASHRQFGARR